MSIHRRAFLRATGLSLATAMTGGFSSFASSQTGPSLPGVQQFLGSGGAQPKLSLPPIAAVRPLITWAGPLSSQTPATTLPSGTVHPASSPSIGGPLRSRYAGSLPGGPKAGGLPCLAITRSYLCKGAPRTVSSPTVLQLKTDAAVVELSGVVADGSSTSISLIVDGELVPAVELSSSRGLSGWNFGTIRVDFGTRRARDIWVETNAYLAYVRIAAEDTLQPVYDALEPQITVVGDSFLQSPSSVFGTSGIAMELAARLGIRKVAVDAVGGSGFRNSGGGRGSLNDRLQAHAADGSSIYLVVAGLNDYGDLTSGGGIDWGTRASYEAAVNGYVSALRAAQPAALIIMTAPFCPNPTLSDSSYVANPAVNNSGMGDFLYKAQVHRRALSRIAGPWVYIDVLMGSGWLNSSGATGDVTNLQWFTGGKPRAGTSASYRPGNTLGGGGGGYGGISRVPIVHGGRYTQAPEILVYGGTGSGLRLSSQIDRSGALRAVLVRSPGLGFRPGSGLPLLALDPAFEIAPARLGLPELMQGINPDGAYPLPSFAPSNTSPEELNNVYTLLNRDLTHPSPAGVSYIAARLARSAFDAIMAL